MSRPQRTWTLDELHAEKCEDVGECWEWTGSMSGRKSQMPTINAHGRVHQAHIFAWMLSKQLDAKPDGLTFWRGCMNWRCINPEHVKVGSKAQMVKFLSRNGALKRSPAVVAKVTAIRRASAEKLSMEKARAIRASADPVDVEAAKYGCHISMIAKVRANLAWRESVAGASVFHLGTS